MSLFKLVGIPKITLLNKEKVLFRLQKFVSVLAILQMVVSVTGMTIFVFFDEEYTPRVRNFMDPFEDPLITWMYYIIEVLLGMGMVAVWKPCLRTLKICVCVMLSGVFVTSFTFFWSAMCYSIPTMQDQLVFTYGLVFHLVQVAFVHKFVVEFSKVNALEARYLQNRIQAILALGATIMVQPNDSGIPDSVVVKK